jgi:hypothetical protein
MHPAFSKRIAIGDGIVASQNYATAVKIVPARGYSFASPLEDTAIESCGDFDIGYGQNYSIKAWQAHLRSPVLRNEAGEHNAPPVLSAE